VVAWVRCSKVSSVSSITFDSSALEPMRQRSSETSRILRVKDIVLKWGRRRWQQQWQQQRGERRESREKILREERRRPRRRRKKKEKEKRKRKRNNEHGHEHEKMKIG